MASEQNGRDLRDDAVERVLRGLREVAPPEGMQARIARRLAAASSDSGVHATGFGWRGLFVGYGQAGAWWRGAVSGAAVAVLVMAAGMVVRHGARGRVDEGQRVASVGEARAGGVVVTVAEATPCAGSRYGLARARRDVATPKAGAVLEAGAGGPQLGRPQTLADAPLTAEERGLVRLVQVADPRDLTTLTPEAQAELQAKEAADFESFFPPPPPPAKDKDVDENEANEPPGF